MANAVPVQGISGGTPIAVTSGAGAASTGTITSVASGVASVTLLAANANRKGASGVNTDANMLYVLCAAGTASATNFTIPVASMGYFEIPFGYTGIVSGIWAADGTGLSLMTEYT